MEESKFFKYVWRCNGVIIMIAGLLAIGILLFVSYKLFQESTREREVRNIVNVEESSDIEEKWQLGYLSKIQGTSFGMIPLYSDQNYTQSYYDKSSSSVRNYLFINSENDEKGWLFNNNNNLISDTSMLSVEEFGDENRKVIAILYEVIKSDTNDDQRITNEDLKSISISRPNGKEYKEILTNVDVFVGQQLMGKDNLLIVYQRNNIGYSARVNLTNFSVSDETELPKIGH